MSLPGEFPPTHHPIPPRLKSVLDQQHPFAKRVIAIAVAWVEQEWQSRERFRVNAIASGWNARSVAAYKELMLTTHTLAHAVDKISLSKLRRSLEEIGAPSPGEIIRAARLCLAERLLRDTRLMVREITRRAGYSSEKHFATKFREVFGCPPSEYRRRLNGTA